MNDILLFTLDDLGDRQVYVLAIFAIVLLAIIGVLLRDGLLWFEGLSQPADAEPADDDDAGDDVRTIASARRSMLNRGHFGRRRQSV